MLSPQTRALFASTSLPDTITQVEERLLHEPGSLRLVSEPLSPFILTAGSWPAQHATIARQLPDTAGVYLLVAPAPDGDEGDAAPGMSVASAAPTLSAASSLSAAPVIASVYVGQSNNVRNRLRDHLGDARRRGTLGFAALSSPSGELSGDHCRAVESTLQRAVDEHESLSLDGRVEALLPLSSRDRLVAAKAATACMRMLRHAGLPLLPDLLRDLQEPAPEPLGGQALPTVLAELRFVPNPRAAIAEVCLRGAETHLGFVVRAGSDFRLDVSHDQSRAVTARREQLMCGGYLESIPGVTTRMRLRQDVVMASANVAARVMTGYEVSNVRAHGSWQPVLPGLPEIR